MPETKVVEIVLTGGSCAGKTESIGRLAAYLRDAGHAVITVPEVATMIINGGVGDIGEIAREDGEAYCRFQREVFLTHRALRRRARSMAEGHPAPAVVVLYDRGELDGMAYHRHDCFEALAAEDGTSIEEIRCSYAAVMHLVTTADGAESFYSKATNSARWDTFDEARRFDTKILEAWRGNAHHVVVDNRTDYAGKLERLIDATVSVLGAPAQMRLDLPAPLEIGTTLELELSLEAGVPQAAGR